MEKYKTYRKFMKSDFEQDIESDQQKQLPQPPLQKPYDKERVIIDLPNIENSILKKNSILRCINDRKSHRKYTDKSITLEELSYLLWTTQGVKDVKGDNYATLRTVPSGGARHPFETYLAVENVQGLEKGVYRYLPLSHQLILLYKCNEIPKKITEGTLGQKFAGTAAVNFIWSCIPYRGEWRYDIVSHKVMLLDAGHMAQNLYLASESIGCGTCAIAAYDQDKMNELIKVDGEDEFVLYMSPVGKVK
ncbi:SagB/ThcOx family dehydrogenase [Dethiothermospora halolimnae]|uniref:SagB/ThcOx family dehydrogenase n=1 Tax=Dethiothermospora halolimnae TaxID=3114390 RepID=UPI003CCC1F93